VAGAKENRFLLQYFVNYNFESGWYLTTGPIITANWEAASGQQWDVPFGGGGGRIVWIGPLPFNLTAQAYYHPIRPENGPNWTVRLTATLLLPRSLLF
ncbi:MAG: neuromedin U, partial [Deltaproteobacteria bacterium]